MLKGTALRVSLRMRSMQIRSILVPLWFIITSLVFFYLLTYYFQVSYDLLITLKSNKSRRIFKKGNYQMNSLSKKESFSSSLWLALFARHSKLLYPSWPKAFRIWFYCIFQSNPPNTWHPDGHTIFVAFLEVLALFRVLEYRVLHLCTVLWCVGLMQLTQNIVQCSFRGYSCGLPVKNELEN